MGSEFFSMRFNASKAASLWLLLLIIVSTHAGAQEICRFRVTPASHAQISPLSIPITTWYENNDEAEWRLRDITDPANPLDVPFQLELGFESKLWFMYSPANGPRTYHISKQKREKNSSVSAAKVVNYDGQYILSLGERELITYNFKEVMPPDGVNPLYARSAFIHPLRSPRGEVLTRIQPSDHYHHYGIWNPWTKTTVMGREIDFWNLVKGEGTVQFAGLIQQTEGELYSSLLVHHKHVVFEDAYDQIAINELWDVRLWDVSLEDVYIADLSVVLNTPLEEGVLLEAYRYGGGLGFRATERWGRHNATLLTSDGKTRADADGTEARWVIAEGESNFGRSGILFLSHPNNRMHPEPLRVWAEDANEGEGNFFIDYCPIRHQEWQLERGKNYSLRYRMIVFDGEMDVESAEAFWQSFSHPPLVEFLN